MAVDKDVSDAVADAVRQVVTELVFPRFDALRAEIWADIQRLEKKLEERLERLEQVARGWAVRRAGEVDPKR